MPKIDDLAGTNNSSFQIGYGKTGPISLVLKNAYSGTLSWTPTSARTLTIPDKTGILATLTDIPSSGLYTPATSGLIADYRFDSASTLTDYSGNAINGTLTNSPSYAALYSRGLTFVSTSSQYVSLPSASWILSNDFYIEYCFFLTSITANGVYFTFGNTSATDYVYFGNSSNNNLIFTISNGTTATSFSSFPIVNNLGGASTGMSAAFLNRWTFLQINSVSGACKFYLNRNYQGTLTIPAQNNVSRSLNYFSRSNSGSQYCDCTSALFKIYSRSLSQTEMANNYLAAKYTLLETAGINITN